MLEGGVGGGGGRGVWDPKVCVPKMAQTKLSFGKFHFPPLFPHLNNFGGGGGGTPLAFQILKHRRAWGAEIALQGQGLDKGSATRAKQVCQLLSPP